MTHTALLVLVLLSAAFTQAPPGESQGTPEARAAFEAGRAAARAGDTARAAAQYRKAIDADPGYVEAHDAFIFATTQAAFAYDAQKRAGDEAARKRAENDLKAIQRTFSWTATVVSCSSPGSSAVRASNAPSSCRSRHC